jgi:hypothetical protein
MLSTNQELQLAADFVLYTNCNIFLTGKAGTGKTTFLHNLEKNSVKRMIITAPTGVAAINAGGVTLHSFFQLPFGPCVPGSEGYERHKQRRFRFSKEKKQIIKSLDLLVIDEISMVRADLLDAVDEVLRRYRYNNAPFGGVQLLMIGDLHQLSPVARQDEWQLLESHYPSVYFFSSHALAKTQLVTVELQHIFRQSDDRFIELLNRVRNNQLDTASLAALNQRYIADFSVDKEEGYITLTTHNRSADTINRSRLAELPTKEFRYKADISGDFPEHIYPTTAELVLKKGAQVMFVRNDMSVDKLFYNGKIGKVTGITSRSVQVTCPGETLPIEVEPVTWENIKYTMNQESGEIEEDNIGEFEQFPLKLAWAITIHKSQGLTFERAVIDAGAAFAHGQVYVALSRCKSFEGMVLSSPLGTRGIGTDQAVLAFDEHASQNPPSGAMLEQAKMRYQQQLLLECFDLEQVGKRLGYLAWLLESNATVVRVTGVPDLRQLEVGAREKIFTVSNNFKQQLQNNFKEDLLPDADPFILERLNKASAWFQEQFSYFFTDLTAKLHVETDNTELAKKINNVLNNLKRDIAVKRAGIESCAQGFSATGYLRAVSAAEINFVPEKAKKKELPRYSEEDIDHPELFKIIRQWRTDKAKELDVAAFQIFHQRVLFQLVMQLPTNLVDLRKIPGVGKVTVQKYGDDLIEMIAAYCETLE